MDNAQSAEIGDVQTAEAQIQAQDEVPSGIQPPDQRTSNIVWLVIVSTFAAVLFGASLALVFAVFYGPSDIQILLTVVTTIAGILAGFISGRSSTGG